MSTFSLLGVNGEVIGLEGPTYHIGRQPTVFGMAPVETGVSPAPALSSGSRRGESRLAEWPLVVPLIILSDSPQQLWEAVETLARALNPARGDCVFIAERPEGERREIVCHYTAGLVPVVEGTWSRETTFTLTFRCPHPFWRATTPVASTINFPVTGSGLSATPFSDDDTLFSDLYTPFDGYASTAEEGTVLATLTNSGSAPAWPYWRFAGPLASIACTNLTTGRAWEWARAPWSELAEGEIVEVRTFEQSDAVRLTTGQNRYRGLKPAVSDLWPLETGDNLVLVEVTGAGSTTTASVEFHPEYLTC